MERVSVYFPLELPISEENRFIHDNFTESSTESRVFPGEEEAFRIAVAGAYAKLFAMERANEERSAIGRTKKTH